MQVRLAAHVAEPAEETVGAGDPTALGGASGEPRAISELDASGSSADALAASVADDRGVAPTRSRRRRIAQVVGLAAGLGVLAALLVLVARTLVRVSVVADFMTRYPGEYEIAAAPGIPAWVGWQHFLNVFLIVLIIRSGLHVRSEQRPPAYWTSRRRPSVKISLTLWWHLSLDVMWLLNGAVFMVLIFTTGHWQRIVPTSWEVFPNAVSAVLQYASLDWPTEHGWANYNSVQQLAYFTTVFIAAPVAAVTGFRMSGWWPKRAEKLSRAFPIEWARRVHFPVMLYFVVFIVVHVVLVLTTGMLRNLNHMFAAQDAATWTGFWVFLASLVVIAAGWYIARPALVAPVARLFGSVSSR
ncbi:cytochrome b/b6 domain-containing protein [Leucobacter sp. USHLN153]|uniref:cytochrome b/b6 domain-containing protein n=1 Tax=Leucobacter sp. USHLN153 TaxID=3081268 RepID=UPI00301B0D58